MTLNSQLSSLNFSISLLPLERALLDLVEQAEHEHEEEEQHRRKDRDVVGEEIAVDERPRDEEHDLDVEQDEKHRRDVELDREPRVRAAIGQDAALVGRVLDLGVQRALAED